MGTALSMTKGAAGRADKATIAAPKALGPRVDGGAGQAGTKGHCMARPGTGSTHHCKRASKHLLSQKKCNPCKGH